MDEQGGPAARCPGHAGGLPGSSGHPGLGAGLAPAGIAHVRMGMAPL